MSVNTEERIIRDKIFDNRRNIPEDVLKKLVITGDKEQVDDGLSRNGWQGETVAAPVIVTDPDGKILGSKWAIRGPISKATIKTSVSSIYLIELYFIIYIQSIWLEGPKDLTVHFNLEGSNFDFGNRGAGLPANFSNWINAADSNQVVVKRGDTVVTFDEISKGAGACIRLEVHTSADVNSSLCYLTLIPVSHPDLLKIAEKWEVDITGSRIPVIACQMGPNQKKSLETKLMIPEDRSSGYGLGILPLIQQVTF